MKNILIVEDEDVLRELMKFNLEKEGFLITEAPDANFALQIIEDVKFDLILLDLMLPGLQGIDFLKIVREKDKFKNIPVMIISAKNSENDIVSGLEAGADDYLTKPFPISVLKAKVKAMLRRQSGYVSENLKVAGIELNNEEHFVKINNEKIKLSAKEFQLLSIFMKNQGKVFTRSQLLNLVWGYDADIYTRTVDVHVSSLRKKLKEKGSVLHSLPKIGYKLEI